MMEQVFSRLKGDRWLWIIVIVLSVWSLLAVYSSVGTLAYKEGKGTEVYLIKHTLLIFGGFALMYFSHKLDYHWYAGISKLLMAVTIPLLLYTLFFGTTMNEASRWVKIPGINLTFQTSDLAKLALITYLARTLTRKQENITDVKKAFLPIMGSVCLVFVLIAPANLSTALMLFGVSVLLLLIGRVSFKQIMSVCMAVLILLLGVVFLGPRRQTYISRVETYMGWQESEVSKDKSFQSDHAKIAIATGGVMGKGPGNSTQRNVLPHPYSDFIFAIIIEEYGTIGGVVLVALYVALMFRCIRIVTLSPKAFGALLAAGLGFSLTLQALGNMAVAVGLGPVTGIPLPLVSMGGTSILFTSIAFGIILSVSRNIEEMKERGHVPDLRPEKISNKVIVGEI